jgi:peptide/nickel transport system substrate-binding protein
MKSSVQRGPTRFVRVAAILAAGAVIAVSCGSSGGDDASPTTAGAGGATTAAGGATTVPAGVSTLAPTTSDGDIKRGGKLTYAVEAETATGFSPLYSQFAISGEAIARAIYDPVTAIGEDGKVHGVLAESFTSNADATQWVVKMRSGITFHDGTPLQAEALRAFIEAGRCSALVATAYGEFGGCPKSFDASKPEDPKTNRKPVSTVYKAVTVDPADPMKLTIDLLSPFAVLDYVAAGWWLVSPKQVDDATNSPKNPIGTGPFKFKEWLINDSLTVVKNPDYWIDAPDGEPYPYLDEIVFKPIDDIAARESCLPASAR